MNATPSSGRWLFLGGCFLALVGPVLYGAQLQLLHLILMPWYAPIVGTIGLLLILLAGMRRWTVVRLLGLLVCGAVVGVQWLFLVALTRTPAYTGPAPGQPVPAFTVSRADGTPFTDRDLRTAPTALLLFRGRW